MDEIVEMRIKFLETLLRKYIQSSENAGIEYNGQEASINIILDELSKLYKQRGN